MIWPAHTAVTARAVALLAPAVALAVAISCAPVSAQPQTVDETRAAQQRGQAFAERHCATCHAIGPTDASTDSNAVPLRDLSKRYKLEYLEEAFAEGIVVGHEGAHMPEFQLEPHQIDDLIAFLKTL